MYAEISEGISPIFTSQITPQIYAGINVGIFLKIHSEILLQISSGIHVGIPLEIGPRIYPGFIPLRISFKKFFLHASCYLSIDKQITHTHTRILQ